MMRDFVNFILNFIGSTSLTTEEFEGLDLPTWGNDIDTFNQIKMLLIERDETTEIMERLEFYFKGRGVDVGDPVVEVAKSNIFIGSAL